MNRLNATVAMKTMPPTRALGSLIRIRGRFLFSVFPVAIAIAALSPLSQAQRPSKHNENGRESGKRRAREVGIIVGELPPGEFNDV